MQRSTRIAPPNSLVFISDPDGGQAPIPVRGARILSTPSCISVGCQCEIDGDTQIKIGGAAELDPGGNNTNSRRALVNCFTNASHCQTRNERMAKSPIG
jgi:hypothetical protein